MSCKVRPQMLARTVAGLLSLACEQFLIQVPVNDEICDVATTLQDTTSSSLAASGTRDSAQPTATAVRRLIQDSISLAAAWHTPGLGFGWKDMPYM